MPIEAKKFAKINKDWEKLMVRASETKFVIACCANELLRTTLPVSKKKQQEYHNLPIRDKH